ncbi:hypothetical protein BDN67DRAFT_984841 [Paxillus ammoniavirescens]|nr:hypothetical protein BDN67DRAFT_984841 [Paxillus ammoniavirescens]
MSTLASGVGITALTIAHLPQPGSQTTPEKFKGDYMKRDQEGNWPTLKNQILKLFDTDRDLKQYKVRNLDDFVCHRKYILIKTLSDWTKFIQGFITIADWL